MAAVDIAIISHVHEAPEDGPYFVYEMAKLWRERGIESQVVRSTADRLPARLAILHVDRTVTPVSYRRLAATYPRVLNGGVVDIGKRHLGAGQDHLRIPLRARPPLRSVATMLSRVPMGRVGRASAGSHSAPLADGPLLVKSNRNFGGAPELRLDERSRPVAHWVRRQRDRLPWPYRSHLLGEYPIFDRAGDVPVAAWWNPALVVERFLPERHGELYGLRTWMFLGDRSTHSLSLSEHPIVKSGSVIHREELGDPPAELRAMRQRLGFDFGKFDYAEVDGRVVLYDANRTPTGGGLAGDQVQRNVAHLADGIESFL